MHICNEWGDGDKTRVNTTADAYYHVHSHALNQFYLGRQGATDFHPTPQKERTGLVSLYNYSEQG